MTLLQSKNLTLGQVQKRFDFQRQINGAFEPLLQLSAVNEFEQQEINQIRADFDHYLSESKVLEGLVKALTVLPLLRLARYYRSPITLSLEENIETINIVDEETQIVGRLDILAVNREVALTESAFFWTLIIEAKNSAASTSVGLPQLLTYAYKTLEQQPSVWGLVTNGVDYQFVYLTQGTHPCYELMPLLNLLDSTAAALILSVLKAIRQTVD